MANEQAVLEGLVKEAKSVESLADQLGVSRATVYNWRKSGITPGGRFTIAHAFPHTASKLFPKFD